MKKGSGFPNTEILKFLQTKINRDFFEPALLNQLVRRALDQTQRKEKFIISEDERFPSPLDEAAAVLASTFETKQFNTAILKRYIPDESSEAFKIHKDPDEFQGKHIFM